MSTSQRISAWQTEMAAGIGLGYRGPGGDRKFWILLDSLPVDGSTNLGQKNVSSNLLE